MATSELIFNGISYEEDVIFIPFLTPLLKQLHLIFPTMFAPFVLKHQLIFVGITLGIAILSLILHAIFTPYDVMPTYEKEILEADFRDFFGSGSLKKRKLSNDVNHEYEPVGEKESELATIND